MASPKPSILILAAGLALISADAVIAQSATPPVPIPTPPIPAPPRIGPAPGLSLGGLTPPARPAIVIPGPPAPASVIIPPPAAITPADKNDPAPLTPPPAGPPPMVSPGGAASQIEEVAYIIDPGASQVSPLAQNKLRDVAQALGQNPAARLEVRTFSPSKGQNQSNAHRLSLARFLAIREFLVKSGVDDNKIDGRALISQPDELNADRIELYIEH